jgi:hypothetical protein
MRLPELFLHKNCKIIKSEKKIRVVRMPLRIDQFTLALWIFFELTGSGYAHTGIVDGYGCHRGTDKVRYHCHQGEFIGRTFKSKEDFLRQLRGGKSEQLSPKSNPPRIEKKQDE